VLGKPDLDAGLIALQRNKKERATGPALFM